MDNFPPPNFVQTKSAVPGIMVFMPAPDREEHQQVVEFSCPQCGGETAYSVADGGLTCTFCGYHDAPVDAVVGTDAESFEFTVATVQRAVNGWGVARKEMQCQSCGSMISVEAQALTTACPFCNSNKVIQRQAPQDVLRPRFLIPFQIEEDHCHQIARAWLGDTWLVPKALRQVAAIDSFTPMYLPYWTFGSTAAAGWKAQVGRTQTYKVRGKTHRRTVWKWESGRVQRKFEDLLIRGTNHVSLHLLGEIDNYNLKDLVPYEPKYLAGMHAQAYEIGLEDSWEKARHGMREKTREDCRSQASTSKIRNFSMQLDFQDESWRYILLPAYINTYFFDNKPYQVLINGQTGVIAGQRPADWRKIALVAAGLTLPGIILALILMFGFPAAFEDGGALFSFFIFVVGLAISVYIAMRAQRLDKI